jgi:hypothetical protein
MTLQDVVELLHLTVRTGGDRLDRRVTGGYTGDLMSDVIANSQAGEVWFTMQSHVNVVAVAVLKDLSAVVLVRGREPDPDTLRRAAEEHVPILTGDRPAFTLSGELYQLLQRERQ